MIKQGEMGPRGNQDGGPERVPLVGRRDALEESSEELPWTH